MKSYRTIMVATATLLAAIFTGASADAQTTTPVQAKNVVLVHGAWADGSSWAEVIPYLQKAGLNVTAVQNPLSSLKDSAEAAQRVIDRQDGPTVLVGHSWSGTVVNQVGGDPKISALVYIAARAPDADEDFVELSKKFPTGPVRAGVQNFDGYTRVSEDAFLKYFANGVPEKQAKVLYAVQGDTAASIFADRTTVAAWHTKPTFYAVAKQDKTIDPGLERFLAKRMNAKTIEVDAGHLAMVSHPREIASLILEAAGRKALY
ncbi:MAG: alpha/beta hydrolase [Bradyrhizobiaceae bacterium]|nr:MAG: alpha/beta hydrolase [Bradyrhizobiaceae bacterium]